MANSVYTIGYGAREMRDFLGVLNQYGIEFLIDVRSQPYSQYKPDFNRETLQGHLGNAGIKYVFMGDGLGGRPEDPACYTDGDVDYEKCRHSPAYQKSFQRLQNAHSQNLKIALMCSEGKPEQCHRVKLIGVSLENAGIPTTHIDENNRPLSQEEVMWRVTADQPSLFAPPPPPPDWDDFGDFPIEEMGWEEEVGEQRSMGAGVSGKHFQAVPLTLVEARKRLSEVFGYDEFRPLQEEIIEAVLAKQDAIAIMPTGSGKSMCFQLPALLFQGLTVVVSPLISLMEDQVMQLQEVGIPALYLNSSLNRAGYDYTVDQLRAGAVKLLYVAPETLSQQHTLDLLATCNVVCLTIDEAHCVSTWGHDFRPDYRTLSTVRQRFSDAVCIAVTATATERVRQDIQDSLGLPTAKLFLASFNRENLFLGVAPKMDGVSQLLAFLKERPDGDSGIIYCGSRRQVDNLAAVLQGQGLSALGYHAGMDSRKRSDHQKRFVRDDVAIMVATVAFGMGINKSNVRFVVHFDLPKDVESYYQQIGRAGRDGLRSDCLLLFSGGDVSRIRRFNGEKSGAEAQAAEARLQALLRFAETRVCRRKEMLAYFGEDFAQDDCDFCDACLAEDQPEEDATILAQKFLSCVKRTGEMFGATYIIDVLRGSQAKKILQKRHNKLSTYGIGADISKKMWQNLAQQFISKGLLKQDPNFGGLHLTEKAYAVFKGEPVMVVPWDEPATYTSAGATALDYDAALFNLLRTERKTLADAGNVPPYVIFSDRTLQEMASYFPQSEATFAQMHGVGGVKLEKYAGAFLPVIVEYCRQNNIPEKRKAGGHTPPRSRGTSAEGQLRMMRVGQAFNAGIPLQQIADDMGFKLGTIIKHLGNYINAGNPVDMAQLQAETTLSTDLQAATIEAFAQHGATALRPVFDALNEQVHWDDLRLMRLLFLAMA